MKKRTRSNWRLGDECEKKWLLSLEFPALDPCTRKYLFIFKIGKITKFGVDHRVGHRVGHGPGHGLAQVATGEYA